MARPGTPGAGAPMLLASQASSIDDRHLLQLLTLEASATPFRAGYHVLKAYAYRDPEIRRRFLINIGGVPFTRRKEGAAPFVRPDAEILGLTCQPVSVEWVERMVETARELNPRLRIWVGGEFAPLLLKRGRVRLTARDLVFQGGPGRGEEPFRAVLAVLASKGELLPEDLAAIPGLLWKPHDEAPFVDNGLAKYLPLAEQPSPYLEGDMPIDNNWPQTIVKTNWGCPYSCAFCSSGGLHKVDWAPLDRTLAELEHIVQTGHPHVSLWSQGINYGTAPMRELLTRIPANRFERVDSQAMLNDLDAEQVEVLGSLARGVFEFNLGVNTFSPKAARIVGRPPITMRDLLDRVSPLRGHCIFCIDYMFPMPGETFDDMRRNVEALLEIEWISVVVRQAVVSPHVRFGRDHDIERRGIELDDIEGMQFMAGCSGFPRADVERAQQWVRDVMPRSNLLRAEDTTWWRARCEGSSPNAAGGTPEVVSAPAAQAGAATESGAEVGAVTAGSSEDPVVDLAARCPWLVDAEAALGRIGMKGRRSGTGIEYRLPDEEQAGGAAVIRVWLPNSAEPAFAKVGEVAVAYTASTFNPRLDLALQAILRVLRATHAAVTRK